MILTLFNNPVTYA